VPKWLRFDFEDAKVLVHPINGRSSFSGVSISSWPVIRALPSDSAVAPKNSFVSLLPLNIPLILMLASGGERFMRPANMPVVSPQPSPAESTIPATRLFSLRRLTDHGADGDICIHRHPPRS
jgi:hypothetical protein